MLMKEKILQNEKIRQMLSELRLPNIREQLSQKLLELQTKELSATEWLADLLRTELDARKLKEQERKLKKAKLPIKHQLNDFDIEACQGLSKPQLTQLRQLGWVEQYYNLFIMGPSGTGKTFLAAGLCFDALQYGYSALFRTMEQICQTLKLRNITHTAKAEYLTLKKANLVVLDDLMMMPLEKDIAHELFQLIDFWHQRTSLIITTNKSPEEWTVQLGDQVLATAILDRLLFHCQVVKMTGYSYRMQNRKTIFEQNED